MFDLDTFLSLLTLTGLEIVLGIDNIVVIAIIAATLPVHQRDKARIIGLALAMITRLLLLFTIAWMASLTTPWIEVFGASFSGRDLLMLGGGLFLIVKAVREMHEAVEAASEPEHSRRAGSFAGALAQIVMLDVVFSFDSVITAVGMAQQIWVMATAVIIAVLIMLVASGPIVRFIHVHPSVKMLALAFVLLSAAMTPASTRCESSGTCATSTSLPDSVRMAGHPFIASICAPSNGLRKSRGR